MHRWKQSIQTMNAIQNRYQGNAVDMNVERGMYKVVKKSCQRTHTISNTTKKLHSLNTHTGMDG